jgi:hypothetical protein
MEFLDGLGRHLFFLPPLSLDNGPMRLRWPSVGARKAQVRHDR